MSVSPESRRIAGRRLGVSPITTSPRGRLPAHVVVLVIIQVLVFVALQGGAVPSPPLTTDQLEALEPASRSITVDPDPGAVADQVLPPTSAAVPTGEASSSDGTLTTPAVALADESTVAPWASNPHAVEIWSAPRDGTLFTTVPSGATFRVLEQRPGWARVFYAGDRAERSPGEAWVQASSLVPARWPRLARLRESTLLRSSPQAAGDTVAKLQAGDYLEVIGSPQGSWAQVFYLGDGRRPSVDGWIHATPAAALPKLEAAERFVLGREVATTVGPSPWLNVPYRSQLDGSAYEGANCGPTTANMILEAFGHGAPQPTLRKEVLALQPAEDCDDCGSYIQNLAEVIARRGLDVHKLRDGDPNRFHTWTIDEIRGELSAGRPVLAQVYYRGLPGRETTGYFGDHYIVLTGMLGDRFIYNDSIDSDGGGFGRVISSQALDMAMRQSDFPYAAFSVGPQ